MSNRALTKTLTYGVINAPIQQRGGGRRTEVHESGARRPAARAARVSRHVLSGVTG